jgi:hypothetical protein
MNTTSASTVTIPPTVVEVAPSVTQLVMTSLSNVERSRSSLSRGSAHEMTLWS